MTDWDIGYLWWAQRLTYFAVQSVTYLWVTNCILYQHYDEFFIPLSWSFSSKCPNRDTYRPGYGGVFFLQISQFFASDLKVWPTYESVTVFSINIVMNFPCLSVGYFFYLSAPTEILIDPDKEVCFFFQINQRLTCCRVQSLTYFWVTHWIPYQHHNDLPIPGGHLSSFLWVKALPINTLRLKQNGCHFPDDIFNCIFLKENI